jgi:trimethylamine--corrinoid protein Co-methyltransferase
VAATNLLTQVNRIRARGATPPPPRSPQRVSGGVVKRDPHAGRLAGGGLSLSVFTADELEEIHMATLEVLEQTGVWVESAAALDLFADGGCRVDREAGIARIPPQMVEDAIDWAPSTWTLHGLDQANDIVLGSDPVGFANFGEGLKVVDPYTGELRDSVKADLADVARLVSALPDIDCFEVALGCSDAPPETATIHNYEATLLNCSKPSCTGPQDGYAVKKYVEMASAAVGGIDNLRERPILMLGTCPVSPLKLGREFCEIVMEAARAGMPVEVLSMAMAGASAPVTLAGTLVTHNAEVLAGITLAQLAERGTRVVYGSSTTSMDLRLAAASVGTAEMALISAGVAQLARQYRLPSYISGA